MKITIASLLSVSSLVLLGAAGCAQPGTLEEHPAAPAEKDAGSKKDSGKGQSVNNASEDEDEDKSEEDKSDEDKADEDKADEDKAEPEDDDTDEEPVKPIDAGVPKKDAGGGKEEPKADAGSKKDAGGDTSEAPAACPSGYMCSDSSKSLKDMGLSGTTTDADGKPVTFSCAKGGQEVCDPKDPKKSCPNFDKPFCIHVTITGLFDGYQCGQVCKP